MDGSPSTPSSETLAAVYEGGSSSSRRRGVASKRKAASLAAASFYSFSSFPTPPPSKRQAKERNPFHLPPQIQHNGPLTRAARHSPLKLSSSIPDPQTLSEVWVGPTGGDVIRIDEEEMTVVKGVGVEEEEKKLVDAEFEAVRSRGSGVHVVPTFAGWFSWKNIHQIEKQSLASFFNEKSEKRTPKIYLGIRNFIMKKFHAKPQVQLEQKDLSELSIGETEARQEVMEFLDHWGLINFHPFLPAEPDESKTGDKDEASSLFEKLYQFETIQSYLVSVPNKAEVAAPALVPSLLPEPGITEDLVAPAEPSVEYHCNSCSADCSRKRYHCQIQADYDLCSDCYNEGKFDTGMAPVDFILMESAEIAGLGGGTSWTDQETLLLLEALEIFGPKWTEIAEHVATKTRTQCMLHFLQMPIEDSFLYDGDASQTIEEIAAPTSTTKESAEVTVSEKMEIEDKEGKESSDGKTSDKTEGELTERKKETDVQAVLETKDTENLGNLDPVASSNADSAEEKNSTEVDISSENASNIVIDVLKSAFEAVGKCPRQGDLGSFTDAGNPVMALAAFLAGLVQHDNAITSYHSSLKAISEVSPALQLAARHCFILEDPPSDTKDPVPSVSLVANVGDECQKQDNAPNLSETEKLKEGNKKNNEETLSLQKESDPSISSKEHPGLSEMKEPHAGPRSESIVNHNKDAGKPLDTPQESTTLASEEAAGRTDGEINEADLVKDDKPSSVKESDDSPSHSNVELGKTDAVVQESDSKEVSAIGLSLENGDKAGINDNKEVAFIEAKGSKSNETLHDCAVNKLKRAAATAISAAAVKTKLLAEQEGDEIRQLVALMIEKQLHKLEIKLSLFSELENVVVRVKEQIEKTRQKLLQERSQIIASRLGLPVQSLRPTPVSRISLGYGPPSIRPPSMMSDRAASMRRP